MAQFASAHSAEAGRQGTPASYGTVLTVETIAGSGYAAPRVRRGEETLMRVVEGAVRLLVAGEERLLGLGDEARVPAGEPYRLANGGPAESRLLVQARPLDR